MTGRRLGVPNWQEEINCKWQTLFSLLYTKLKEASFKFCVVMTTPGSTWTSLFSNLELTNAFFLWKCFSQAMLRKLCICLGICLSSNQFHLRFKPWTDNGSANQCVLLMEMFSSAMLTRLHICLETCLSLRFMSIVLWLGMTHLVPMLSQSACRGRGAWCNSLSFEVILYHCNCSDISCNAGDPTSIPGLGRSLEKR